MASFTFPVGHGPVLLRDEARNKLNRKLAYRGTATTKRMLEEAEERVSELEAQLPAPERQKGGAPSLLGREHLKEMKQTLERNPARARELLATLLSPIVLRREEGRVLAEVTGNLKGLFQVEEAQFGKPGSGGWI
jgi:hypothetical protein